MTILESIRREENKLEKQLHNLKRELDGVRAAGKALSHSSRSQLNIAKRRTLSAAGRARIAAAARKRWAKVRAEGKKATK